MSEHIFDPAPYTIVYDESGPCLDCGRATVPDEYYNVRNDAWQAAGITPSGGMLCIGCLEHRLDRRLVPEDFTDHLINQPDPSDSPRLRDRKRAAR